MDEQAKILRVLKLISLLNQPNGMNVHQLAKSLSVDKRTIYRYLKLLENCGFIIDQDFEKNYFIHQPNSFPIKTDFSSVEVKRLKQLAAVASKQDPIMQSILKKVYENSDLPPIKEMLLRARLSQVVEKLYHAISKKKQCLIKSYHSAHSATVSDRLVEPIELKNDYSSLLAYEPESEASKFYKLDRMAEVIVLEQTQKFQKHHQALERDVFGMSGDALHWVSMQLSLRAYTLMREEFPLSVDFLNKNEEDQYFFIGPVRSLAGIGRFVLGLPGEISQIKPNALVEYLLEKQQAAEWNT